MDLLQLMRGMGYGVNEDRGDYVPTWIPFELSGLVWKGLQLP